jgi:hypothetical protein
MIDPIFDLEQKILSSWNITDDLRDIVCQIEQRATPMSNEEVVDLLNSVITLYNLKFDVCFGVFESVCHRYHALRREESNQTTL